MTTFPSKSLTSNCFVFGLALLASLLVLNACFFDEEVAPLGPDDVQFPSTDGTLLSGHHYGYSDITVVLAHMFPSDPQIRREFADILNKAGYAAFSFNFRGFKPSKGDKEIPLIDRDLEGALEYLESRGVKKFFIIGASMAGTAAIKVAAHRDIIAGVVTISAPLEINGLAAEEDVKLVSGAKLFLAAEDDKSAQYAAGTFYNAAKPPKLFESFSGSEHGTDLLYGQHAVNIQQRIIEFIDGFAGSTELR